MLLDALMPSVSTNTKGRKTRIMSLPISGLLHKMKLRELREGLKKKTFCAIVNVIRKSKILVDAAFSQFAPTMLWTISP